MLGCVWNPCAWFHAMRPGNVCLWETMHVVDNWLAFDILVPECACGRISWSSVLMARWRLRSMLFSSKLSFLLLATFISISSQMTLREEEWCFANLSQVNADWRKLFLAYVRFVLAENEERFCCQHRENLWWKIEASFWFLGWNLTLPVSVVVKVTLCLLLGSRRPTVCLRTVNLLFCKLFVHSSAFFCCKVKTSCPEAIKLQIYAEIKKKIIILECGDHCSNNKELESERQESFLLGIKGSKKVQQVIQSSISASILPSVCFSCCSRLMNQVQYSVNDACKKWGNCVSSFCVGVCLC